MAKNLSLASILLVAMQSLATANTYTTTITTTIDDETNRPGHQQCQQQLQGHRFRSCQRYLQQGRGGGLYDDSEDSDLVPALNRPEQRESLMQCCEELRNVNEQCRCEAIKQALREQQQEGGGYQGEEFQKVYERARDLPRMCQMRRPQQCQLSGVFL
ncbi:2S seed storage albumin protein-like [Primulina eburnea]|uniref:2S seed storage albumin protein-like n=1 Tax=Primulina eburnea TaxID=1245227 RepID=UPI003C6C4EC7